MTTVVAALGALNLLIGFAVGVLLDEPRYLKLRRYWLLRRPRTRALVAADSAARRGPAAKSAEPIPESQPATATADGHSEVAAQVAFPDALLAAAIETPNFARFLHAVDHRLLKRHDVAAEVAALSDALGGWIDRLSGWQTPTVGGEPPPEPTRQGFQDAVLDAIYQTKTIRDGLPHALQRPTETDRRVELRGKVIDLLDGLRRFQRQTWPLLAAESARHGRLHDLPADLTCHSSTQVLTYLGMQQVFQTWREGDTTGMRLVSGVLVEIDRYEKMADSLDALWREAVLGSFGGLLKSLVRKDRGFDRVAHLGGGEYFIFMGDTSVKNAVRGAERLRQVVEATALHCASQDVAVTISMGIAELAAEENLDLFLERLRTVVADARRAGPNHTCFADETGRTVAPGTPLETTRRSIDVSLPAATDAR